MIQLPNFNVKIFEIWEQLLLKIICSNILTQYIPNFKIYFNVMIVAGVVTKTYTKIIKIPPWFWKASFKNPYNLDECFLGE